MKETILFVLFAAPAILFGQAVPNGNFENWTFNGWGYNPDGWETANSQLMEIASQDLDAYEGIYAMKVTAVPIGVGDYGQAETTLDIGFIPPTLDFFVKTEVQFGYVEVVVTFYNNELEVISYSWSSTESLENWTAASIDLFQIEPILTHAKIRVTASVGDLISGTAVISVDAMAFGGMLSTDGPEMAEIEMFPNPASLDFTIKTGEPVGSVRIYDLSGKCVRSINSAGPQARYDVRDLSDGVYLVSITDLKGVQFAQRLVVRK